MRLTRLVLAGALAGASLLAGPASADAADCVEEPCYECVMYPCHPGDWVEFLGSRACDLAAHACK